MVVPYLVTGAEMNDPLIQYTIGRRGRPNEWMVIRHSKTDPRPSVAYDEKIVAVCPSETWAARVRASLEMAEKAGWDNLEGLFV
jgi:hypothetical protein